MSAGTLLILLALLAAAGFVVSLLATRAMLRVAPRIGLVDRPGHRKIHHTPKPLGGGTGIFLGVAVPMIVGVVTLVAARRVGPGPLSGPEGGGGPGLTLRGIDANLLDGVADQLPLLLTFLAVGFGMYLLGLVDDRRPLGPFVKLGVQLGLTVALVLPFPEVRLLTVLGLVPSVIVTVLWIAGVTNALNFLDNMDGLAGGVAAICGIVLLLTSVLAGQVFVPATLALFVGSCVGFLVYNFPPSKLFMGDSGSLFIGLVLGVMTVRTTYLSPGESLAGGWYGVFAPLVVLAVPLYDMTVVSVIRLARGKSPFVGDTNHFSHRLVARGMTKRTAVLCIWLVTAATGAAALLLPLVDSPLAAWVIFVQTLLILGVVMLLERHPVVRE
jgi:UDP-GlcNAc:undecaprenyl-phosphate GlcNAc-1-phosphate transferase